MIATRSDCGPDRAHGRRDHRSDRARRRRRRRRRADDRRRDRPGHDRRGRLRPGEGRHARASAGAATTRAPGDETEDQTDDDGARGRRPMCTHGTTPNRARGTLSHDWSPRLQRRGQPMRLGSPARVALSRGAAGRARDRLATDLGVRRCAGGQSSSETELDSPDCMTLSFESWYFSILASSVGREIPSMEAAFDFL